MYTHYILTLLVKGIEITRNNITLISLLTLIQDLPSAKGNLGRVKWETVKVLFFLERRPLFHLKLGEEGTIVLFNILLWIKVYFSLFF